ncbi:MAG: helix-turn-helix transcriptional regulator [Clostridia bacterium]|nr:helix-turn-helix transcriptional regulator [Clostridia bacterium]
MANRTVLVKNIDDLIEQIVKNGYSYRKLAEKANCSQTQISLILKGERNPSPENAINICKALGCNFDDIFFINNDYKSNQK